MIQLETAAGLVGVVAASAAVYAATRQRRRDGPQQASNGKRPPTELFALLPEGFTPLAELDEAVGLGSSPAQVTIQPIRARRVTPAARAQTPRPAVATEPDGADSRELISLIGTMQWDRALSMIQARGLGGVPAASAQAEAAALERVRALPDSEVSVTIGAYRVLAALAPANDAYADKLAQCEARLEARRAVLLAGLPRDEDRFEAGTVWYNHPWNPRFDDVRRPIWPYIGIDGEGRVLLRLRTNWLGDSRISVRGIELIHDGLTETLTRGAYKIDAEALGWEWRDEEAGIYQLEVLRSLVAASEVTLRYLGDPWPCEAELSPEDKQSVADILELYDLMRAAQAPELAQAA